MERHSTGGGGTPRDGNFRPQEARDDDAAVVGGCACAALLYSSGNCFGTVGKPVLCESRYLGLPTPSAISLFDVLLQLVMKLTDLPEEDCLLIVAKRIKKKDELQAVASTDKAKQSIDE